MGEFAIVQLVLVRPVGPKILPIGLRKVVFGGSRPTRLSSRTGLVETLWGHVKAENPHLLTIDDPAVLAAELERVRRDYNAARLSTPGSACSHPPTATPATDNESTPPARPCSTTPTSTTANDSPTGRPSRPANPPACGSTPPNNTPDNPNILFNKTANSY